jgi:hypothetical protein
MFVGLRQIRTRNVSGSHVTIANDRRPRAT